MKQNDKPSALPTHGIFDRKNRPKLVMVSVTAVLIVASYILFHQDFPRDFIEILPLFVSLVISLMQTEANRYAFLLGGINSIFYAAVYFSFGIYASAVYALAASFPLQIWTFIRWSKHAYGKSTVFKKLSKKHLILLITTVVAAFTICYVVFDALGSRYLVLDNATTVLGTLTAVLCAFAFVDYVYFNLFSQVVSVAMYIQMMLDTPVRAPYLIYAVFALICLILTTIRVHQLYRFQQEEQKRKSTADE